MKVVALGYWSGEKTIKYITTAQNLQLSGNDIAIIDGQGDRLLWTYEGLNRQVSNILPTPAQKEELQHFLEQGGTIITFPADPFDIYTIPLYPEEVPEYWEWRNYRFVVTGGLAEVKIPIFDWLPTHTWNLLKKAYDIFVREKKIAATHWHETDQLLLMTQSTIQAITIDVGQGKIVVCREQSYIQRLLMALDVIPASILQQELA